MKPEFFADEKVNEVSRDARYLTIGLITRADDRGRQQNMDLAILGHVYPRGDVSIKQLQRWLAEILAVGIARAYDRGPFAYLWLPSFWKHQKINRPSESDLPAHPEEPYAALPIEDAIKAYRTAQGRERISEQFTESDSESLIPSRGSSLDPEVVHSSKGNVTRAQIDEACSVLSAIERWEINEVGIENAFATDPGGDLIAACHLAVTWGSDSNWTMGAAATLRAALRKLHDEKPVVEEKAERRGKRRAALEGLMTVESAA